jgi:superfamily II DNA/RNA helicase
MNSFSSFQFLTSLQKTLSEKNLSTPTEIQTKTIPLLMEGRSVVGVAQTGSGKTIAYALPLLHKLKTLENEGEAISTESQPRAIVMVPSRDLGEQVAKVFKTFTHDTRLRVRSILGGTSFEMARKNILGNFEILIATPGRLVQMLDRKLISLDDVRILVFDEVDQMLDPGFLPDANLIVANSPDEKQLALFSATVSPAVEEMMETLFSEAEVIRSEKAGQTVSTLKTRNLIVPDGKRLPLLEKVFTEKSDGGTLIFTNTREQCDKLAAELTKLGYVGAIYRGEMDQVERRTNLKKFRSGEIDILISTDLASRGLDVENIGRVINYHLPQQMDNYLHRAGRTARAGREGLVINFVTERDQRLMEKLGYSNLKFPTFSKAQSQKDQKSQKNPKAPAKKTFSQNKKVQKNAKRK